MFVALRVIRYSPFHFNSQQSYNDWGTFFYGGANTLGKRKNALQGDDGTAQR